MTPFNKRPTGFSRRRFLGGSALLSGAAMGASPFSLAATGIKSKRKKKIFRKAPLYDPSFENYPGYSARIPAPEIKEPEIGDEQADRLFNGL